MDATQPLSGDEPAVLVTPASEGKAPAAKRRKPTEGQSEGADGKWLLSVPEGRWCGFGPYYAMFPVPFAREVVKRFCPAGGRILDPFCGRGTAPFVALAEGRDAVGIDLNEVGWLFSSVKADPCPDVESVIRRMKQIGRLASADDGEPENDFQKWAWCGKTLAFLRTARSELNWRGNRRDRTLMGHILVYLHAKRGGGLSNQLRQSKAMSPDYSVKWWQGREMVAPELDPVVFLERRIRWRYLKGIPKGSGKGKIILGDATNALSSRVRGEPFDLVFTSPPYLGVTNYRLDQWIRWWMLGGPALPSWTQEERYGHTERYTAMLQDVFRLAAIRSRSDVTVYVRTDARRATCTITADAIKNAWPMHALYHRMEAFGKATQTALFGDKGTKPGEVDLLALPAGQCPPDGWKLVPFIQSS